MSERAVDRFVDDLTPGAQRELLMLLTSTDRVRADVIRQFFQREGGADMAELLILLEEQEWARRAVVEALERRLR